MSKFVIEPAQTYWVFLPGTDEAIANCSMFVPEGTVLLGIDTPYLLFKVPLTPEDAPAVPPRIKLELVAVQIGIATSPSVLVNAEYVGMARLGSRTSSYAIFLQHAGEPEELARISTVPPPRV